MNIQIDGLGERITKTIGNFIIADGTLSYYCIENNEEHGIDFDDIDTLVITDSPNAAPALLADSQGRTWHVMEREDKSVSIYYTLADDPTHYIVFDSLAAGMDESEEG